MVETLGGFFQVIMVESRGIRTLRHGSFRLEPEGPAYFKSMQMTAGRWIQRDETKGLDIPLIEPLALIQGGVREVRFHDFDLVPLESRTPKWHLTYFLTCRRVQHRTGTTGFENVAAVFASSSYPLSVDVLAAIGLWGAAGEYEIEFRIVIESESIELKKALIRIEYPEELDLVIPITLTVRQKGPALLECYLSGQLLGRRALYFADVGEPPTNENELRVFEDNLDNNMRREQELCRDQYLEDSRKSELVYFAICRKCTYANQSLIFEGQFVSVYWRSYPLKLRFVLATGFRMPSGTHNVKVSLINAATRETSLVAETNVESTSSWVVNAIHAEVVAIVPKDGIYFLNAYVDEKLTGSIFFAAETNVPRYSFTLSKEDMEAVTNGEFLLLLRRSQRRENAINLQKNTP